MKFERSFLLIKLKKYFILYPFALILLFEEWGWDPLANFIRKIFKIAHWEKLEDQIRHFRPGLCLLLLLLPLSMIFPLKLLALYFFSIDKKVMGIILFLGAKILGTAITARLFQLTHPNLMKLNWYARVYPAWKIWKDSLLIRLRNSLNQI